MLRNERRAVAPDSRRIEISRDRRVPPRRESTRERNLLLKNAPLFVHALPTVMPIYSYFGGILPSLRQFLGATPS